MTYDPETDGVDPPPEPGLKSDGEPLRYRRDVPRGDQAAIDAETEHVRAHLSSVADSDDDPDTRAVDVVVRVVDHVDGDPDLVSVLGELDAEPDAPYLRPDYDPGDETEPSVFTRYSEQGREGGEQA